MNSSYQLIFAQHDVPGLWNSLRIHIFHTEYRSSDGTWFRDEKFLYRNGTVQYFVSSFGGWGLMSGVMRGSVLYYTYWGSGIHRSLLGRLFLDNYTIVIQESGGYIDKDFTSLRTMEGDTTEGATH